MVRYGIASFVALVCCGSITLAADAPHIKLQPFVTKVDHPTWFTSDGTQRLFVVEQVGKVRIIGDGQLVPKPYLDITDRVMFQGEMGLLCCVFHPDFAKNGFIYVDYVRVRPRRQTVISEFHVDPKSDQVDPTSERVILTIDQPYPNHNGGQLLFGPDDGMLYIGMGDGGSANDPQNRAQNLMELLGKVLRIDVAPREGYGIPKDNPFVGRADAKPEIWTWGMRNAWRMSFDRKTHALWCGEIGQDKWEEIDILTKGGNYGWHIMEGTHDFRPVPNPPKDLIPPIKEYPHSVGLSITGGFVYRGKQIPSLEGWYIYGDYSKGQIWGLKYEDGKVIGDSLLIQTRTQPSSFGEDLDGEIYECDYNGTIYKIVEDK